jgi:peptide/nickel transport system substrate-binding protein
VADQKKGNWKRFQRLSFDSRTLSRRARKAETTTTKHAHKFVISKLDNLRNAKQHIILWLVLIGVLIAAVALQMFWNQQAYRTMAWKEGGTYAEASVGPINTLNPLYADTQAEQSAIKLLFSSLYRYDDTGTLADDLATSIDMSEDGTEYVIRIRDDAVWSDKTKLTAKDVVYTVGLMQSPEVRSTMQNSWVNVIAEAMDSQTVKFTLPAPYASFPHALTFAVLPQHILAEVEPGALRNSTFSISPVGSGPFVMKLLQSSVDGEHKIVNMAASPNYYKGNVRLARFELHAYESADDMTAALQAGEVRAAAGTNVKASELPNEFITKQYPVNNGVYALLNTQSAILKDSKVRQALQAGTDTNDVRRAVGYEVPSLHLPFVNGQLNGSDVPTEVAYDVDKANNLLNKAGWKMSKDGNVRQKGEQLLELTVVTANDPTYEKVMERLAGQWRKLGIKVNTAARDSSSQDFVQTVLQQRSYDVLLYKLVIGVDPDVYAYWHSSQAASGGYNFSNYSNSVSDDALSSARVNSNPALRNEKYKAFARQWVKDVPAIGLYQSVMQYVYRPSVDPVITHSGVPSEIDRFNNIRYWSAQQESVYKTP